MRIAKCVICYSPFTTVAHNRATCSVSCKLRREANYAKARRSKNSVCVPKFAKCIICGADFQRKFRSSNERACDAHKKEYHNMRSRINQRRYRTERTPEERQKVQEYQSQWYAKNRERVIAKHRQYYHENSERMLEQARHWREENREKVQEVRRAYQSRWNELRRKAREKNPEKYREKERRYRDANCDRVKETRRAYFLKNKEKMRAAWRKKHQREALILATAKQLGLDKLIEGKLQ